MDKIIYFFPLISLSKTYYLKYGCFGPCTLLNKKHLELKEILPILHESTVNGKAVKNPIIAISNKNIPKFTAELECISFLAASNWQARAEDEIFSQKNTLKLFTKNKQQIINIDNIFSFELKCLRKTRFPGIFPRDWKIYSKDTVSKYEKYLQTSLSSSSYKALLKCLDDCNDKELQRERKRIISSIHLFNQAFINMLSFSPFSKYIVIYISSAFEALLNLPENSILKTFEITIYTLCGQKTSLLKKWCKNFYAYRSRIVHGDTDWNEKEDYFVTPDDKKIPYSRIAKDLFVYCLNRKLFLSGYLKNCPKQKFLHLNNIIKI